MVDFGVEDIFGCDLYKGFFGYFFDVCFGGKSFFVVG